MGVNAAAAAPAMLSSRTANWRALLSQSVSPDNLQGPSLHRLSTLHEGCLGAGRRMYVLITCCQWTECNPRSPHFSGCFPRACSSGTSSMSPEGPCTPSGRGMSAYPKNSSQEASALVRCAPTLQCSTIERVLSSRELFFELTIVFELVLHPFFVYNIQQLWIRNEGEVDSC